MASPFKDLSASVRQRLLDLTRREGRVFDAVLVTYGLERLLYRLSISTHRNSFVLKGGMLVSLWTDDENGLDQQSLDESGFDQLGQAYTGRGRFSRNTKKLLTH